ncbi:hypothetical protein Plec18167_002022 [Paecilomyces lecythidis]|uniref:Xylanolytic transcriptional activator regulatory domain-containing protein n=1 Tax=Paecilomyces lecythidis TaxID=3004212 RepID=A0ABR3YAF0_9EURO
MLLEDDMVWKDAVAKKLRRLESSMAKIAERVDVPELQEWSQSRTRANTPLVETSETGEQGHSVSPQPHSSEPQPTWDVVIDSKGGPASIPASCISEMRLGRCQTSNLASAGPDLISKGLLSLAHAESLFEIYHQRLDHFLYRILGDHDSLHAVRSASPLLTAAICTVGALHSPNLGHLFDSCYEEFKSLVARLTFSSSPNADDVRGLCIGAFWLDELSWALVGTAVRIAAEIRLHQGLYKALDGNRNAYLQARLYYLVYICDSHFSVAYGRPPMTRECDIINAAGRFLETRNATEDDARLVSQVTQWSILSKVFDAFGVDVDAPITAHSLPQLRRFSISLDTWYADWNERFKPNRNVGNYPHKGVGLHFHFAKLYLCAHAFRGAPTAQHGSRSLSPELEEIANSGVLCAMSILRVIASDFEFQSFLNGLPLYFDTMIAFAVVFLLKVSTKYTMTVQIDTTQILALVRDTVESLRRITQSMHQQHLLVRIAEGLQKLLWRCQEPPQATPQPLAHCFPSPGDVGVTPDDLGWMQNLTNFDFLTNIPNMGDWFFHDNTIGTSHTDNQLVSQ